MLGFSWNYLKACLWALAVESPEANICFDDFISIEHLLRQHLAQEVSPRIP